MFEHDVQSRGVCSKWQGWDGRKHAALGTFSFVLESERCRCQQRSAVNGKGCKGKGDRQVQRSSIWDNIVAQGGNFVFDSLSYWKPVQFSQKWWNVCAFGGFENESSRTILNLLKFVNQLLRYPWQHGITVIKAWQNQGCHKGFGSFNCEDMSNWANSTQFQVGGLTYFTNLLFHGELVIKNHTKIPDWSWKTNIILADCDWEWKVWLVLRINEKCLSFSFIQLQFVLRHPEFHIMYTWLHVTKQRVKLFMWNWII